MILSSEIISKAVLNLYSGKIEGTVKNLCFDPSFRKVRFLKMFDEEDEEYLIDTGKIYQIGDTCVVIKNSDALILAVNENATLENNPINVQIYTLNGENVGRLSDIELSEKYETKNLICADKKIAFSQILNVGENIIVNDTDKKLKLSNFRPKIAKSGFGKATSRVTIMPTFDEEASHPVKEAPHSIIATPDAQPTLKRKIDSNVKGQPSTSQAPSIVEASNIGEETKDEQDTDFGEKTSIDNNTNAGVPQDTHTEVEKKEHYKIYSQPTPQRLVGDGNFLIGRKAVKTIYGLNNEIIIKKDNIINPKNLENAKRHSKLVELTVFSKIKN